ncbi:MAG: phosphomannomutase/phosphoglucomutase [Campylobacterales bacterium]
MSKNIFREYDIRGIFPSELDEIGVKNIGYYFGLDVKVATSEPHLVTIGYDARLHSVKLKDWIVSGLKRAGVECVDIGLVPTPISYYSNYIDIDGRKVSASIMITGSHNPPEYNGFKITLDKKPYFGSDIYALGEKVIDTPVEIEDSFEVESFDLESLYVDFIVKNFSHLKLDGRSFIFDSGNGAVGPTLEKILKKLNLEHKILYKEPDGRFPNHHPDPSEEESLEDIKKELQTNKYDLGFAYDGDGDRVATLSKKHSFKGDILAIFFARALENPVVIGEVKCSQVMYDEIDKIGKAVMYKTGHSNLKVKIKELDASFAAEVSGHLFFNDRYYGYDDALYATFRVLELLESGLDFDAEINRLPKMYTTDEINIDVCEDRKFKMIKDLAEALKNPPSNFPKIKKIITVDGLRVVFEDGWGLIRASNTTPKLVTRFEAKSKESAELYQNKLLELLETN